MSAQLQLNINLIRQTAATLGDAEAGRAAQELRNIVVQKLSTAGAGRQYKRRSRTHQASAPGQAPAVDTGRLRQSITVQRLAPGKWRTGTNLDYAFVLEFGSRRTAPRPFMRPAAEEYARTRST